MMNSDVILSIQLTKKRKIEELIKMKGMEGRTKMLTPLGNNFFVLCNIAGAIMSLLLIIVFRNISIGLIYALLYSVVTTIYFSFKFDI